MINFLEVKEKIENILNTKNHILGIDEPVAMIDGVFRLHHLPCLDDEIWLGGDYVPAVMVIGINTGLVYWFSYNALMEIEG